MRTALALVLLYSLVRSDFDFQDKLNYFSGMKFFVHHIENQSLETEKIVKSCFDVPFSPPNNINFKGSEYLFKLLRTAYFYDLKSADVDPMRSTSIFSEAKSSYGKGFNDSSPIAINQPNQIEGRINLPSGRTCEIEPKKINELIVSKLSDRCVFPKANGGLFAEGDFNGMNVDIPACSDMLNGIMDRIISRFEQIMLDSQIDFFIYSQGVKYLVLVYSIDLLQGNLRASMTKLRLLLLNEFLIIKKSSNPDLLTAKRKELNDFISEILGGIDTLKPSTEYKAENFKIAKDEMTYLKSIILNKDIDVLEKQKKDDIIQTLLTNLGIRGEYLLI